MHYPYKNQILLSNSFESSPKYSLEFFFFSEIIQFNLLIFMLLLFLIWFGNLFPKIFYSLSLSHIYIVIHRQICFVLSELISVARHINFP